MSNHIVSTKRPLASTVRAWGAEQNAKGASLPGTEAGTRGRLNPALVAAYNKAHKGGNAYSEKDKGVKSVTVKVKPAKGRAKEVRVSIPEARKALAEQGVAVGKRGRLSTEALSSLLGGEVKA